MGQAESAAEAEDHIGPLSSEQVGTFPSEASGIQSEQKAHISAGDDVSNDSGRKKGKKGVRRQSWLMGGRPPGQSAPSPQKRRISSVVEVHREPVQDVRLQAKHISNRAISTAVERVANLHVDSMPHDERDLFRSPDSRDNDAGPTPLERLTFKIVTIPGLARCLLDELELPAAAVRLLRQSSATMESERLFDAAAHKPKNQVLHLGELSINACCGIAADVLGLPFMDFSDQAEERLKEMTALSKPRGFFSIVNSATRHSNPLPVPTKAQFRKLCGGVAAGLTTQEGNIPRPHIETFVLAIAILHWLDQPGRSARVSRILERIVGDAAFRVKMVTFEKLAVAANVVKANLDILAMMPDVPTVLDDADTDEILDTSSSPPSASLGAFLGLSSATSSFYDSSAMPQIMSFVDHPGSPAWIRLSTVARAWRRHAKRASSQVQRRRSSALGDLYSQKFASGSHEAVSRALQLTSRPENLVSDDMGVSEIGASSANGLRALAALRRSMNLRGNDDGEPERNRRSQSKHLSIVYERNATASLGLDAQEQDTWSRHVGTEGGNIMKDTIEDNVEVQELEARIRELERLLAHKKRLLSEAHSRIVDGGGSAVDEASAELKVNQLVSSGRRIKRLQLNQERLERELANIKVDEIEAKLTRIAELRSGLKQEMARGEELECDLQVYAVEYDRLTQKELRERSRADELHREFNDLRSSNAERFYESHRYLTPKIGFPSSYAVGASSTDRTGDAYSTTLRLEAAQEAAAGSLMDIFEQTEKENASFIESLKVQTLPTQPKSKSKAVPSASSKPSSSLENQGAGGSDHLSDVALAEREYSALYESTMRQISRRYVAPGVHIDTISMVDQEQGFLKEQHENNLQVARAVDREVDLEAALAGEFQRTCAALKAKVIDRTKQRLDRNQQNLETYQKQWRESLSKLNLHGRPSLDRGEERGDTEFEGGDDDENEPFVFSRNPLYGRARLAALPDGPF